MKKLILSVVLFVSIVPCVKAQAGYDFGSYDYAIGLRSGGTSGLTIKKNYGASAIEGIVGFWNDGLSLTGLWEKNQMAFATPGLNWVYGVGGHVAFYGDGFNGDSSWFNNPHDSGDGSLGLGVDGTIGLEYKIENVPIAFGFNFKPYLELVSDGGVLFSLDPGIGIKVAF